MAALPTICILFCFTAPAVQYVPRCPPLQAYDRDTQSAVSRQIDRLPAESRRFIRDYGRLRQQCRQLGR